MITSGDDFKIELTIKRNGDTFSISDAQNIVFNVYQYGYKVFTVPDSLVSVNGAIVTAIIESDQSALMDDAGFEIRLNCNIPDNEYTDNLNNTTFVIENPSVQSIGGSGEVINLPVSTISATGKIAMDSTATAFMRVRGFSNSKLAMDSTAIGSTTANALSTGKIAIDSNATGLARVSAASSGKIAMSASATGTAEFNIAGVAELWLKSDAGITYSSGSLVESWADQSDNGYLFEETNASEQLEFIASQINGYGAIGTPAFADQLKRLMFTGAKSVFNFLHDGTTDYTIYMVKKGYDGSSYTNCDFGTEQTANIGTGPGFISYRADRSYVKNTTVRVGASNDNNIGYQFYKMGIKDVAAVRSVFNWVHGGSEVSESLSGFTFDLGDSLYDLSVGRPPLTGSSRVAMVEIIVVKTPTTIQDTEIDNYIINKYAL